MKLKTVAIAAAALALAVGMTACGGAASTAASSTASSAAASSEAASSEAASSEAASSEAEATSAEYTVYNTTGSKVTELYLYDAGSEDKGENLAGEGLADGESIVITRDVEADKQDDVVYVLEFTTEDGNTQSFDTLHYEVAPTLSEERGRRCRCYRYCFRGSPEVRATPYIRKQKKAAAPCVQQPFCIKSYHIRNPRKPQPPQQQLHSRFSKIMLQHQRKSPPGWA